MLTPENKWICLQYFHRNKDRRVEWASLHIELLAEMEVPQTPQMMMSEFMGIYIEPTFEGEYVLANEEYVKLNDNDRLRINDKGIAEFEKIEAFRSRSQQREETSEQIQELTKVSLTQIVDGYPKTESRAKWGFRLAWGAIGLTAISIVIQLCKDDKTQVVLPPQIDTTKYRTFFEQTKTRLQSDSLSFYKIESYVDSLQRRIDSLEAHEKKK